VSILEYLRNLRKKRSSTQTGKGLLRDEDYRLLVSESWLSLAQIVFRRQRENLLHQTTSLYNPGPGSSRFEELVSRRRRSRRELLEVKLFLDYCDTEDPSLGEIESFYVLLLREDYYSEIRNKKFKEPFDFILKVPFQVWRRYKTQYLPKPRFLGSLWSEREKLRRKSLWTLIRKDTSRPCRTQRPRGYRDRGHLASSDSLALTKVQLEYQKLKSEFQRLEERRVFYLRAYSVPERAAGMFIQELQRSPVWTYIEPGPTWQSTIKSFRDKHGGEFGH
jgi:hypothetical protein